MEQRFVSWRPRQAGLMGTLGVLATAIAPAQGQTIPTPLVYNVTSYGAVRDGSYDGSGTDTDNRAAIQSAIDAAASATNPPGQRGGTVYLPHGVYVIDGPLTISGHSIRIVGESRGDGSPGTGTAIVAKYGNNNIIQITADALKNPEISTITLAVSTAVGTPTSGYAIELYNAHRPLVDNIQIQNVYNGIHTNGTFELRISDVTLLNPYGPEGILLDESVGGSNYELSNINMFCATGDRSFPTTTNGIHLLGASTVMMDNVIANKCNTGFLFEATSGGHVPEFIFGHGLQGERDGTGAYLRDYTRLTISDSMFNEATQYGWRIGSSIAGDGSFNGISADSNALHGILVQGGFNTFSSTRSIGNSTSTSGNPTYDGLHFDANVTGQRVLGGQFGGSGSSGSPLGGVTQRNGIRFETGDDHITVVGTDLRGNGTPVFVPSGAGSDIIFKGNIGYPDTP